MKYFLSLLFLLSIQEVYSQAEQVNIENRVYRFLERMENKNILNGYNSFEIPKSRKEISEYLKQIKEKITLLTDVDKETLYDLEVEFENEIFCETTKSVSMIGNNDYDFLSENQKYLYFLKEQDFNLFINLYAGMGYQHVFIKDFFNNNASFGSLGGIIRGTALNKIGFYIKGTNGLVSGNIESALYNRSFAQNFKFTEKPAERFYDDTEGYFSADFDILKIKLGRDRLQLGYGQLPIVDDFSPAFDQLGFSIGYKFFSYSYIHAKMLDYSAGNYQDKYFVYHRIGFNINRHFDIGAGEFVIYGRRGIDLSYLNPFAFYKTIEHSNRDRDNSMLFFDINNNSINNTKIHFSFLIDDISYGKIGTGWYGNTTMLNAGLYSSDILNLPADVSINYRRTEPYTFTHRLPYNNWTNSNYSLSSYAIPNSEMLHAAFYYRLNYRLEISSGISYIIHGANKISGSEIINYGGDINLGFRELDNEKVSFLEGVREYFRKYDFNISYEIVNDLFIKANVSYSNKSTQTEQSQKEIYSLFTLTTVF